LNFTLKPFNFRIKFVFHTAVPPVYTLIFMMLCAKLPFGEPVLYLPCIMSCCIIIMSAEITAIR
jgi:hypothetical protein